LDGFGTIFEGFFGGLALQGEDRLFQAVDTFGTTGGFEEEVRFEFAPFSGGRLHFPGSAHVPHDMPFKRKRALRRTQCRPILLHETSRPADGKRHADDEIQIRLQHVP